MAKNNLMQSGENVDAMLRNNTDLANGIGRVRDNESRFLDGIGEQRNTINRNFQGDEVALRGEVEAGRNKEILALQERLRQEQLQREMQERQLAAQAAARAASANKGPSVTQQKNDLKGQMQVMMSDPKQNHKVQQFLESSKSDIISEYGIGYYKELEKMYWNDIGDYYALEAKKATSKRQNLMY